LEEEKYGESNQNGSEGKAEDCDDRFYQSRAFQCPGGASSFPPSHLDSCHALARDGEVVRAHYPRWYTGPKSAG
jgi:hypothetical protein